MKIRHLIAVAILALLPLSAFAWGVVSISGGVAAAGAGTETINPSGDGWICAQWAASAGDKYSCVSDNDDATYITATDAFGYGLFHFTNSSELSGKTIDSITIHYRARYVTGADALRVGYKTAEYVAAAAITDSSETLTSTWTEYSYETGFTTLSAVDDYDWGVREISGYSNRAQVSKIWIVIAYH